jgi:endoglucanase
MEVYVRLVIVLFFIIVGCTTVDSHHTKTSIDTVHKNDMTYNALMGVGVNTIRDWSSCERTWHLQGETYEYKQIFKDGWKHLNYIICAQNHFPNDNLDEKYVRAFLTEIRKQIDAIQSSYPDRAYVITFKGYQYVGGWSGGHTGTLLYQRIIKSEKMQDEYVKWWKVAADVFDGYSNVAFSIMNEPDYRYAGGLRDWQHLATRTIDEIRKISPNRWIQLEGVNGSVVCRDRSLTSMLRPIDRPKIMYAFHCWPKLDFAEHDPSQYYPRVTQYQINSVKNMLKKVTAFKKRFNVPVVINEIGIVAKHPNTKGGTEPSERAKYVREAIMPWYRECKCGITWWAYGDNHTPYHRKQEKDSGPPEFTISWRTFNNKGALGAYPIKEKELFNALGVVEW